MLLIGCKNEEKNRKFKQIAEKKLSDSYEIRELHGINRGNTKNGSCCLGYYCVYSFVQIY